MGSSEAGAVNPRNFDPAVQANLKAGAVIPAHPLALDANRRLDERRQVALTRYYCDAGAGGLAVGVHTTQFAIRDPKVGLLEPVLHLALETMKAHEQRHGRRLIRVAGVCGATSQAMCEAALAREIGYDLGLLSLGALREATEDELIKHCRCIAEAIPLFGFYLQPAVGGRKLCYSFWRRFLEIENVFAVKVAPFNRYQTLDVVRALADSGRCHDVLLYTGNDDSIVFDLLAEYRFARPGGEVMVRFAGGLLGHWAVWTQRAVELLERIRKCRHGGRGASELLACAGEITDANAAFFDVQNGFAGCIAGIHEVLRRQGLLVGRWCLDPEEDLSPGQAEEIDRVYRSYPHLNDDEFVACNLDRWLA
ncbi:MAG TPA: dihydrodipicolinate synthase family protein [Acidobacteriota bacterium]|nr:dihydrodipicolinate synthase family protein [Acidobacteriota bacterium]